MIVLLIDPRPTSNMSISSRVYVVIETGIESRNCHCKQSQRNNIALAERQLTYFYVCLCSVLQACESCDILCGGAPIAKGAEAVGVDVESGCCRIKRIANCKQSNPNTARLHTSLQPFEFAILSRT